MDKEIKGQAEETLEDLAEQVLLGLARDESEQFDVIVIETNYKSEFETEFSELLTRGYRLVREGLVITSHDPDNTTYVAIMATE